MSHIPVLLQPILEYLSPADRVIDGTLGAGGHTRALLDAGIAEVLSLDIDSMALEIARANLQAYAGRVHIVHASYWDMVEQAHRLGWSQVDGILLDVGVSSMQLDHPERGFAFMQDGPLDMRFNPDAGILSAADLVNTSEEDDLANIFYKYGEEPQGRKLARGILASRPYETTRQLAGVIEKITPRRKGDKIHPATRVFQALRIAVNDELGGLERVLPQAINLLKPGGRLAVISFHSLEDRIVKQAFKLASTDCICPPNVPVCVCGHKASVQLLTRKPIIADEIEIAHNPRSRSAKLRVVEKLAV
ncbi:MAG: 16S rRNA (cytosine(1402)-N(4))-methyltransferase RsmH [Chloroflexi bacterium]|nr:16S rRNA (cytosine(1402)-N(4))-methyltransferase RsmH [Chloroflexota bacterium]